MRIFLLSIFSLLLVLNGIYPNTTNIDIDYKKYAIDVFSFELPMKYSVTMQEVEFIDSLKSKSLLIEPFDKPDDVISEIITIHLLPKSPPIESFELFENAIVNHSIFAENTIDEIYGIKSRKAYSTSVTTIGGYDMKSYGTSMIFNNDLDESIALEYHIMEHFNNYVCITHLAPEGTSYRTIFHFYDTIKFDNKDN